MSPHRLLNRGHGPADPRREPPSRTPGSVRRTTTIDISHPDGFTSPLHLVGRGRELSTRQDGDAVVLGTTTFSTKIAYPGDRQILTIDTEPAAPELSGLIGHDSMSGFRRRLDELLPVSDRTLLRHLLDDIPGATLISGHPQLADGDNHPDDPGAPTLPILAQRNVCAGWRDGSTLMNSIDDGAMIVVSGPVAPTQNPAADPLAWHELPPATPTQMRRHRLLDVSEQDGGWRAEAYFRDSHWPRSGPAGGRETVIHEYALTADVSAELVLTAAEATPLVLPWNECLSALGSPALLLGSTLAEIDERVRSELRGPGTCTHLNDVVRSLVGISTMLGAVSLE